MASRYSSPRLQRTDTHHKNLLLGYYRIDPGQFQTTRHFPNTERWDNLAHDTQHDSKMWWIIADVNPYVAFDPFNRKRDVVTIPAPTEGI